MRHIIEQHHAQQNQTDADNPNEISFLTEKHHADQSRQNQSTPAQMVYVASGIVFSAIGKVQNTTKSWLPLQQKERVGFVANLVSRNL